MEVVFAMKVFWPDGVPVVDYERVVSGVISMIGKEMSLEVGEATKTSLEHIETGWVLNPFKPIDVAAVGEADDEGWTLKQAGKFLGRKAETVRVYATNGDLDVQDARGPRNTVLVSSDSVRALKARWDKTK